MPVKTASHLEQTAPYSAPRFDSGFVLTAFIFVVGLFIDGWAHFHGKVDDSFFTPWHAAFYGGFFLTAVYLFAGMLRGRKAGLRGRRALPKGYDLTVIGVLTFALGGVGDLGWHTVFGIESGPEALFSTSHLTLVAGMFLIVTGPYRSSWHRQQDHDMPWTAIVSGTLGLTVLSFITSYANPLAQTFADGNRPPGLIGDVFNPALGMTGIMLTSFLWMGLILLSLRRWHLRPGTLAVLYLLNIGFMSVLEDEYRLIAPWLAAGLIGDVLYRFLKPGSENRPGLRWFAFLLPVFSYTIYFLALEFTTGIWWRVHTWSGALTVAGVVGLFISYLIYPPAMDYEKAQL